MSDLTDSDLARPAASDAASEKKRVHIKSFGCQMNVYDATRMADVLARKDIPKRTRRKMPI